MTNRTIECYNQKASQFQNQYLSLKAEDVHQDWINKHLPKSGLILDVGAGGGRDALFFSDQGLEVIAVEPATDLAALGKQLTQQASVQWIEDSLPNLKKVIELNLKFDLIILSAVWMHITLSDRGRAFRKLANLLKPSGKLVITLRHGNSPDEREMHSVSLDELTEYSKSNGLTVIDSQRSHDQLARVNTEWETVVMQLPDDGSGAFPTIRHIALNDSKSSTYKLALLRTLLRIADGHPGAVIRREDGRVILPMGLIALYWMRQYKPLIERDIQQNSVASKGLGFIKPTGWKAMGAIATQDLAIGQLFFDDQAQAIHQTLKDVASVIEKMPVKYITLPNSQKQVFEVAKPTKRLNKVDSLYLDLTTLHQYGELSVPEKIWDLMTQYACWIEPVVLNEWVLVMKDFKLNRLHPERQSHQLLALLQWQEAKRTTDFVRKRVEQIQTHQPVYCVWDRKPLKKAYAIDHCLPFARWPNNDLWNLLPSNLKTNLQKSDKIPTRQRFLDSKQTITHWWSNAWSSDQEVRQFFTQASLALPMLDDEERDLEAVFDAMLFQSMRLVETQQLMRW